MPLQDQGSLRVLAGALGLLLAACGSNEGGAPLTPAPVAVDTFSVTTGGGLLRFNRATPASGGSRVAISGLGAGETIAGFDIRPADGSLFLLTRGAGGVGRLYTVTAGGAATPLCTLAAAAGDDNPYGALDGSDFGLDFNPVPDRLRVVSDSGQNLRVNPTPSGTPAVCAAITDGTLAATGITAAAYTNSFAAACRTTLFYVDSATQRLLTTSAPNEGTLSAVGPLGVVAGDVNGFEITTAASGANVATAVLTVGGTPTVHTIDLATGAASPIGALAIANGEAIVGLATAPPASAPVQAAGELLGLTSGNRLVSFERGAPAKLCSSTAVSGLAAGDELLGFDARPANGTLVALARNGSVGRLYTIDRASGAATAGAALAADTVNDATPDFSGLAGTQFGIDFNPVPDRLRVVSDAGQNLRINVDTGATITDGTLKEGTTDPLTGVSGAAYTNSIGGGNAATLSTTLFYLDAAGNRLLTTTDPNGGTLTAVGALGIDIGAVNGIDIDGRSGVALIAVTPAAGGATTTLHTVDLATGAASTALGTVGGGEALRGLTFSAAPPVATAFAITQSGRLVSFAPATPGTVTDVGAIGGLQGGETIVGLDVRPATGTLVALSDAGRLYSLDPASAAASPIATLAADAADMTAPFSALAGMQFGVDFNPVPDRLRVVSDAEQNLRIVPTTGATTTDSPLSADGSLFAAAYTNSFAGARSTALYALDAGSDSLVRIGSDPASGVAGDPGNPNSGVVTTVGAFGGTPALDVGALGGFDIAGGHNGFVLAVLQPAAGGPSALYRIQLATGAATKVADVATPAASPLTAFALRLP